MVMMTESKSAEDGGALVRAEKIYSQTTEIEEAFT